MTSPSNPLIEDVRFPTGKFTFNAAATPETRRKSIDVIRDTPRALRAAVAGLSDAQIDTPYRDGGWTVRQVVHHVPESHMNAYLRFKWGLTETNPTIKPYDENAWASLPDVAKTPAETSLALLENLHKRWVTLLESMTPEDFARPILHPEQPGTQLSLDWLLQLYAWHGPHHTAHITGLRKRSGW
jgi:uncharacterized damage-inducible protein DinB